MQLWGRMSLKFEIINRLEWTKKFNVSTFRKKLVRR